VQITNIYLIKFIILATVITNLLSAIPYIGMDLVIFVWGSFSASNPTLNRFFSLHYLLPFVVSALVIVHIFYLHEHASNNPLGINSNPDKIHLHPYFTTKDLYFFFLFFILISFLVFYFPNYLNHPDNYIPANPLVTPLSITPEWYLLVPYAILRVIPNKLLGVVALLCTLLVLFILPLQASFSIRSNSVRSFSKIFFWLLVGSYIILTICGALPVSDEIVYLSIAAAIYYFSYFLIIIPLIHTIDSLLYVYK
jgi:ubiquinol-cytochrome c reductase cytochrome b subunit